MKTIEFIQRAENGGFPVANEDGFEHGTPVLVVQKRELMEYALGVEDLLKLVEPFVASMATMPLIMLMSELKEISKELLKDSNFLVPLRKLGMPKED